jgi:hypothetical protein
MLVAIVKRYFRLIRLRRQHLQIVVRLALRFELTVRLLLLFPVSRDEDRPELTTERLDEREKTLHRENSASAS